jgi:hypothetical protein
MNPKTQKALNWFLIIITELLLCASIVVSLKQSVSGAMTLEASHPLAILIAVLAIFIYLIIQKVFWGKKFIFVFNILAVPASFFLLLYAMNTGSKVLL